MLIVEINHHYTLHSQQLILCRFSRVLAVLALCIFFPPYLNSYRVDTLEGREEETTDRGKNK